PPITIYTLSLHDALPILNLVEAEAEEILPRRKRHDEAHGAVGIAIRTDLQPASSQPQQQVANLIERLDGGGRIVHGRGERADREDRKSTRLNSSHDQISY